ncbi:ribonuclease Z [Fictibacillus gelatini]|uniref:ribonuclease Z n=1 Tax=Fictibacillus gelatini TaxID=225985 RepID=UPI0003F87294|nr:ribonuclease Z [Fictibacillus gelatini]
MEIQFLGTGAGMPSKQRNVTAVALTFLQSANVWLFDCGEATQHQILHTSIRPRKIEKIFITHMHGDHIFGLPGLLGSRSFQSGDSPLVIYGPEGIRQFVETSLKVSETHLTYPFEVVEIEEGLIFEDSEYRVFSKKLDHVIDSFGYRIEEKERPGKLKASLLKAKGIPPGPIYKKLKDGEDVKLQDGLVLYSREFLTSPLPGRVVAILGDTRYCENAIALAKNADVLVHEATFSADLSEHAQLFGHATTKQAAEIAVRAGAKQLILTHISSRYQKEEIDRLLEEAKTIFENTTIAEDFSVYALKKKNTL